MGKTILAIDDDANMLLFYKALLTEFGEVRLAANLREARKQLSGVDLIILDFHLEQDAELIQDIARELKELAPILLCSGVQDIGVQGIGASLGISGYWNKGPDHETLRSLVRSTLAAERGSAHE